MNLPSIRTGLYVLAAALIVSAAPAQQVTVSNIPNFHQVNEHVFRGAQPLDAAWPSLAKLGVTTVIDLRRTDEHSTEAEAKAVTAAGMKYLNFPMKGFVSPSDSQVQKILATLHSGEKVFIHCKRGADRTGAVIACYRMSYDGWDSKRALSEAKSNGMSWTQLGLKSYVKSFQPKAVTTATTAGPSDN
jgi:protein tyrosine/serine phosphatase